MLNHAAEVSLPVSLIPLMKVRTADLLFGARAMNVFTSGLKGTSHTRRNPSSDGIVPVVDSQRDELREGPRHAYFWSLKAFSRAAGRVPAALPA